MTRAQLLCAWAVASEAPLRAEFELGKADNNGDAVLKVVNKFGDTRWGEAIWKLPRAGGREKIAEYGHGGPLETAVSNDETLDPT